VDPLSSVAPAALVAPALARASSSSVLDQVDPLLWIMIAISTAGAIVTFAVLTYALIKFRDPSTRRRRYG
jgi:hypothetical protein